ncbi:MAG: hypothetical protein HY698_03065 [Deltaproteobacteria bacterium]|nr:hypothetical protein [Deltaproteobacteria bacterium]
MVQREAALLLGSFLLVAGGCKKLFDKPEGGLGSRCEAAGECDEGLTCVAGRCATPGTVAEGGPCWATRDCVSGLYCTPLGTCAPSGNGALGSSCSTDRECTAGMRCLQDGMSGSCTTTGTGELGATCTQHQDCLAGLFCGTAKTCAPLPLAFPPFKGVECVSSESPFRMYFELPRPGTPPKDFYRLPFPNDARVSSMGKLDMSDFPRPGSSPIGIDLVQLYVDAWALDFAGFSSTSSATFRFSDELDFDSTLAGGTIRYVDLTPGPTMGEGRSFGWSYSTGRTKYSCGNRLTVYPDLAEPLLPGHKYAVWITTGARAKKDGAPAVQDRDLKDMLAGTRPTDETLAHAWDTYKPFRDYLAENSLDPTGVAGVALFTVQDTTGHMQRLAADVAKRPLPKLSSLVACDAGVKSPCDDGTPQRACEVANADFHEIHGKLSVPIYQEGTPPYETPAEGGGIREVNGAPQLVRTEDVCFALTIPKKAAMPAGGWPLLVYHHGTGGSFRSFIRDGIAAELATSEVPSAALSFDGVEHGERRGDSKKKPDDLVFNPLNPRAARDNFLQGAVDILQAFRVAHVVIEAGVSPTGAAVGFDAEKVVFFGHSQGATSGSLAVAFSDAAPLVVFSGAGAYLTESLLDKSSPIDIGAGMEFLVGEELDGAHPVMTIFQSYFERSDPINYNPLILRRPPEGLSSKHVYMSYGLGDTYTPPSTLKRNARSLGIPPVSPVLEDYDIAPINRPVTKNKSGSDGVDRTAAVFQYAPDGYDGHFVAVRNPSAVADWVAFLQSWLATGTPVVE